jgi:hypothetical protein
VHNAVTTGALSSSLVVNADIDASAGIIDTKLATISTAGKVANSATSAASASTPGAIVARDGSGNFTAGTITANLTGNVTGNIDSVASGALALGATNAETITIGTGASAHTITLGGSSAASAITFGQHAQDTIQVACGAQLTNIAPQLNKAADLGVITGGTVTPVTSARQVDVAAGTGYVETLAGDLKYLSWNAASSLAIATGATEYVYVDGAGTVQHNATAPTARQTILLAQVRSSLDGASVAIVQTQDLRCMINRKPATLATINNLLFGSLLVGGFGVTQNGATRLDVGSGSFYTGTDLRAYAGGSAIAFDSFYGDGTKRQAGGTQDVDCALYDNSGTLTAITADRYAQHALYVTQDGAGTLVFMLQYGTSQYVTQAAAVAAPVPTKPAFWGSNVLLLGSIVVQNATTPVIVQVTDQRTTVTLGAKQFGASESPVLSIGENYAATGSTSLVLGANNAAGSTAASIGSNNAGGSTTITLGENVSAGNTSIAIGQNGTTGTSQVTIGGGTGTSQITLASGTYDTVGIGAAPGADKLTVTGKAKVTDLFYADGGIDRSTFGGTLVLGGANAHTVNIATDLGAAHAVTVNLANAAQGQVQCSIGTASYQTALTIGSMRGGSTITLGQHQDDQVAVAGSLALTGASKPLVFTGNGNTPYTVSLKAPVSGMQANVAYMLPTVLPTGNGQMLTSTTSGEMSWATAVAGEAIVGADGVVRIGTPVAGTGGCFVAGIRGITTSNADAIAVLVDSSGQLGTVSSSQRFKEKIETLTEGSSRFAQLRPVSFTIKSDKAGKVQYGLIAEEVEKIYPELIVYDTDGEPYTIMYQLLDGLFVHEIQRTESQVAALQKQVAVNTATNLALASTVEKLQKQVTDSVATIAALTSTVSKLQVQINDLLKLQAQVSAVPVVLPAPNSAVTHGQSNK